MTGPRPALDEVVARFGPAALLDPVALRSALRSVEGVTADDVELLTALAGSGVVRDLRAAARTGTSTETATAIGSATQTLRAGTGPLADRSDEDVRGALLAFASAHGSQQRAAPALGWTGTPVGIVRRPRRRWAAAAVVLAVAVGLAAGVGVVLLRPADPPAPPDRYALDQVAQRYRALGATLLDGATSCAQGAPQPGQTEVVTCAFDRWTMQLTTYDTSSRLIGVRDRAVAESPQGLREVRTATPDASFALAESDSGSRIYWDVARPRPVSALIETRDLGLLDLLDRYDTRGATAVARPDLPGAAFASGELWWFAAQSLAVDDEGVTCTGTPVGAPGRAGAVDAVRCTFPDGVLADLVQLETYEQVVARRAAATAEDDKVPGSLREVGGWHFAEDPPDVVRGQLAEYVPLGSGPHIHFDDAECLCVGVLSHPGFTQDELRAVWES